MDLLPIEKAEVMSSPGGTLWTWRPARGLLVTRVEGYLSESAATVIESELVRVVTEDGRVEAFHDWEQMRDYDSTARARLTNVAVRVRKATTAVHFVIRSRVVTFGVQVANAVLGNLRVHQNRRTFEAALQAAIESR